MRRFLVVATSLAAVTFVGCGGSPTLPPLPKDAPTVGPHDGPAYALPQGLGYAEVTNEPKAGERDRTAATAIVVYFLKPDAKGAIEAAPSDVKFQVAPSGRNKAQTVALKADPRSGDPAGGGRFASQPGPYQLEELRGELTGKAGATPFKIEIAGAR